MAGIATPRILLSTLCFYKLYRHGRYGLRTRIPECTVRTHRTCRESMLSVCMYMCIYIYIVYVCKYKYIYICICKYIYISMPEYVSDRMPEYMPNRMPEYMSDRMPWHHGGSHKVKPMNSPRFHQVTRECRSAACCHQGRSWW